MFLDHTLFNFIRDVSGASSKVENENVSVNGSLPFRVNRSITHIAKESHTTTCNNHTYTNVHLFTIQKRNQKKKKITKNK